MNGGDTKLSELNDFYKMQKSQLDFLILPVATLVGLDDVIVVVTSSSHIVVTSSSFARIISVLGILKNGLKPVRLALALPS